MTAGDAAWSRSGRASTRRWPMLLAEELEVGARPGTRWSTQAADDASYANPIGFAFPATGGIYLHRRAFCDAGRGRPARSARTLLVAAAAQSDGASTPASLLGPKHGTVVHRRGSRGA